MWPKTEGQISESVPESAKLTMTGTTNRPPPSPLPPLFLSGGEWGGVFRGHSRYTALLVANNALQGMLASFFFKYADTLLKKYSSTAATILTALASAALFGHTLTPAFAAGVGLVLISMHQVGMQGGGGCLLLLVGGSL